MHRFPVHVLRFRGFVPGAIALLLLASSVPLFAGSGKGLDFDQLASIRRVVDTRISPDGETIAYELSVPRRPGIDDDGPAWSELQVVPFLGGPSRAFVHGEVNVSRIRFTPDGKWVTYLAKRGDDEHKALWAIPLSGGESRKLIEFDTDLIAYEISPAGDRVAFVAKPPERETREQAKEKGYTQEVFEEDWLPRVLWISPFPQPSGPGAVRAAGGEAAQPRKLDIEGSVYDLAWVPDGKRLALAVSPRPLVDDSYMFQRVGIHDVESGERLAQLANPGKLGDIAVSPDGAAVAMISAADPNDPAEGRLLVGPTGGGELRDLLPGLAGHVRAIAWQDAQTVMFLADVGVEVQFGEVGLEGGPPKIHSVSGAGDRDGPRTPVLMELALSSDGRAAAFVGESPGHPGEVFTMAHGDAQPRRLTDSNPWLSDVRLGRQEVVRWKARDGLELEGILVHPIDDALGNSPPLILMVHGGPEGHRRNGWNTSYSRPGQLAAGQGFAVFWPNYRGSTGRGVAFTKLGQSDAAGPEFDDLVDAVDHLVAAGLADGKRVGITGGSYGGFATAWCATRYTEKFRAGVMFVGISNKMTKALTTDIPLEDKMVHTRYDGWTRAEFSLERSPLTYVEQSRTPLLIAGGTSDSRVHPSQSLQFYRALKLAGKTPVRYVRYPGERHGNRRAAARDDYSRRLMRWMQHFLVDGATELPPWDLRLGEEETEESTGDGAGS